MEKATNSFFWKPETPLELRTEKILILNKRFFKKRNKRKIKKQISRFNEKGGGIAKEGKIFLPTPGRTGVVKWKFETLEDEMVAHLHRELVQK